MTTVSYVVTVYNKRDFLPSVVESLRAQTGGFNTELVFIDDGSTDGSADLLRQLTTGVPSVKIITQANAGPSSAINRGFREATGEWVKGLDGDDYLTPNATSLLLEAATRSGTPLAYGTAVSYEAQAPYRDLLAAAADQISPSQPRDLTPISDPLRHSLRKSSMNPSCWLARRDLLLASGGSDEDIFIQDYSLELRMAAITPTFTRIGNPVFLWQSVVEDRLSGNGRQILHDVNLAVGNLFRKHPELYRSHGALAAKRTLGRAWHWARREEGANLLSPAFLRYAKACLQIATPTDILNSCNDFGGPIRRPPGRAR